MLEKKNKIKNIEIFYQVSRGESKNPLLILHGWNTLGSQSWIPLINQLKHKNLTSIAPDLPAFGKSQDPKKVWDVQNYVEFLKDFVDKIELTEGFLKDQKWDILGHSFGGGLASVFSSLYPQKVNKLILVAPAIVRRPLTRKQNLIQKTTKILKSFEKITILKNFSEMLKKIWYKFLGSSDYTKTSGVKKEIMQKILRQDLQSFLPAIQTKTLIIWGTLDTYTPFRDSELIQKSIPGSELKIYQGQKHGLHLANQDQLVEDILEFLLP